MGIDDCGLKILKAVLDGGTQRGRQALKFRKMLIDDLRLFSIKVEVSGLPCRLKAGDCGEFAGKRGMDFAADGHCRVCPRAQVSQNGVRLVAQDKWERNQQ